MDIDCLLKCCQLVQNPTWMKITRNEVRMQMHSLFTQIVVDFFLADGTLNKPKSIRYAGVTCRCRP